MGWTLINRAYITWTKKEVLSCTTIVNPSFVLYLPVVMCAYPSLSDLRIVSLTVEPDILHVGQPVTITLVVRNDGRRVLHHAAAGTGGQRPGWELWTGPASSLLIPGPSTAPGGWPAS